MIYGYALEGTYDDKENFFFSLLPCVGVSREEGIWFLQLTFLNFTLCLFAGKGDIEDGEG